MKRSVALICLIMLGCATPHDMRSMVEPRVLTGNLSARETAICVADEWDKDSVNSAKMRETRSGYEVVAMCDVGYPCFVSDLRDVKDGSDIRLYLRGLQSEKFLKIVEDCAK